MCNPMGNHESVKWYRLTAEQAHAESENSLRAKYAIGEGVAKVDLEALECQWLAAEQGDADARYNLEDKKLTKKAFTRTIVK